MFICDNCRNISTPLEKSVRIVVETREKIYTNKKRIGKKLIFKESKGFETVKEKIVCLDCSVSLS